MQHSDAYVGQQVRFGRRNGEKTLGTVVKVNPRRLKIRQDESRGGHPVGTLWTVTASLCTPVSGARTASANGSQWEKRPCLVNVLTGEKVFGRPGESEDSLFGRMANGLL